ncbi:hypothetical protein ACF0H5_017717 [Mactra antiquata]
MNFERGVIIPTLIVIYLEIFSGTADLSAIEVEEDGKLKELQVSYGNNAGGQNINDAFLQHCHDSFQGKEWQKIFSNVTPADAVKMEANFEKSKVQIGSTDSDGQMIEVEIPAAIRKGIEKKSITLKEGSLVQYDDEEFLFASDFVRKELFQTTCSLIYENSIRYVLCRDEAKGIKTVILVGGLSESPIVVDLLRGKIEQDFPDVKVVVPDSPFKSVLLGAVLYGHDPMKFSSRISRETYGVAANVPFDEAKHDESKKWWSEIAGMYFCKDFFSIHVKKGQSVNLLESQSAQVYKPRSKKLNVVSVPIYSSSNVNPKYITDEGCKRIGNVRLEIADSTGGTERNVEVRMMYGGSQIAVLAKDINTGKAVDAEIVFG